MAIDDTPRDPLAALDTLVRAVGDYTWLANGRRKDGKCRICDAPEGVMHADEKPCGALAIAMNEARATLDATRPSGDEALRRWAVHLAKMAPDSNGLIWTTRAEIEAMLATPSSTPDVEGHYDGHYHKGETCPACSRDSRS